MNYDWQAVVFCQNERRRLAECLQSISAAMVSRNGLVTVILNGSTDGSEAVLEATCLDVPVTAYRIAYGDKSNAINTFLHTLREKAGIYFCVDGYVSVKPRSLVAMADRLAADSEAVVATGMAANGRGATQAERVKLETGGTVNGRLYAMKATFVQRMVDGGIRLPVGLYRGDGLLGSMAAHNLDALGLKWSNTHAIGVSEATFTIEPLSPFRPRDVQRHLRRKIRQMRGILENAAIKKVIYSGGYSALPAFADDMIRNYLLTNKHPATSLANIPFMIMALRQHHAAIRPSAENMVAIRIR
jgi:hypothetical protein